MRHATQPDVETVDREALTIDVRGVTKRYVTASSAIDALAGDPALRGTMGVRSRAKAEAEFDDRQVVAKTLDAYRQLDLGRPARRRTR